MLTQNEIDEVVDNLPVSRHDLLFLAYRGSISHGTHSNDPESIDDIDLIGCYLAPDEHYFGFGRKDTYEKWVSRVDVVMYEYRKMVGLLANSNPNVLNTLYLNPEHVIYSSPEWDSLVDNRHLFASKEAYRSHAGYAESQLKKMTRFAMDKDDKTSLINTLQQEIAFREGRDDNDPNYKHPQYEGMSLKNLREHLNAAKGQTGYMGKKRKELVDKYSYDPKNAAHCIRLLRMGKEMMETGELQVYRPDREELIQIKQGEWSLEQINEEAERLFDEAREAKRSSSLLDKIDREAIEKLLVKNLSSVLGV